MNIKCFMVEPVPGSDNDWRRLDSGEVNTLDGFPPGAMWFAPWMTFGSIHFQAMPENIRKRGQLNVKTPVGHWNIDSKSSNGDGWTRSGEPPLVTARPSIGIPFPTMQFHAWLTNGELIPC